MKRFQKTRKVGGLRTLQGLVRNLKAQRSRLAAEATKVDSDIAEASAALRQTVENIINKRVEP